MKHLSGLLFYGRIPCSAPSKCTIILLAGTRLLVIPSNNFEITTTPIIFSKSYSLPVSGNMDSDGLTLLKIVFYFFRVCCNVRRFWDLLLSCKYTHSKGVFVVRTNGVEYCRESIYLVQRENIFVRSYFAALSVKPRLLLMARIEVNNRQFWTLSQNFSPVFRSARCC